MYYKEASLQIFFLHLGQEEEEEVQEEEDEEGKEGTQEKGEREGIATRFNVLDVGYVSQLNQQTCQINTIKDILSSQIRTHHTLSPMFWGLATEF